MSWHYSDRDPITGATNAGGIGWLLIDNCCSTNNNCDGGWCSLPHSVPRISESMVITTSMVDHVEEKRTEQNLTVCSRKSETELALNVLYCWSY